jgi:hypothetical protein
MSSLNDIAKEAEKVLYAGMEEATDAYRAELRPFVEEFGAIIADCAVRAAAGDKDAAESLQMLKEQALTHEFIARRTAGRASDDQVRLVIGTAIKFIINLLV